MIKKYIETSLCVIAMLLAFSCTNEPVQILNQVTVNISPSSILDDFTPYSSEDKEMYSDKNGTSKLRITALIYNESGTLVKKNEMLLNDYYSIYSFSFTTESDEDYTLLCFSSAVDGTLENIDDEAYSFSGIENLKNLKVTQLTFSSYYSNWSVLGYGATDFTSSTETINIDLKPATAFVYLRWADIHANESNTGETTANSTSVYTATANDLSGDPYTWDITIEQKGKNIVLKNLSPFFASLGVTDETGSQIYEGYIENGYIILPSPQLMGFEYENVPAQIYGVSRITEDTIYVDDIKIKIQNNKLVFETGFGTYIEGVGWGDVFASGLVFTAKSGSVSSTGSSVGTGIDEYYIGFHSNDILLYDQNNGFYYKTTLDQSHSYVKHISPADYPESTNIYDYINLLPGQFEIYAQTSVGNDKQFYSNQNISIQAGKQYLMELDCNNMSLKLTQGTMKSVEIHADQINITHKKSIDTDYVTSDGMPLQFAQKADFLW